MHSGGVQRTRCQTIRDLLHRCRNLRTTPSIIPFTQDARPSSNTDGQAAVTILFPSLIRHFITVGPSRRSVAHHY